CGKNIILAGEETHGLRMSLHESFRRLSGFFESALEDAGENLFGLDADEIDLGIGKVQPPHPQPLSPKGRGETKQAPPVLGLAEVASLEGQVAERVERLVA